MDEKDIHISESEEDILQAMESIASEHPQNRKDDDECLQACCDLAELAMELGKKENVLGIDVDAELAAFHRRRSSEKKSYIHRSVWYGAAGVAAAVLLVFAWQMLRMPAEIIEQPLAGIEVFEADKSKQQVTLQVSGESERKPLKEAVCALPSSAVQVSPHAMNYQSAANAKSGAKKVQIHRLSIPRGETFKVLLSDGTEVLLNADSRLSYPTIFKGKQRTVTLEGEAYFKVAKDSLHPFVVKSGNVQVSVLGTEFGVRGYVPNDVSVTLLEGKVAVSDTCGTQSVEIHPGERAQFASNGKLQVEEVDAESLVYWKEGYFYFDDVTLVDMMKDIGRWYNIGIEFRNEEVMGIRMHFFADRRKDVSNVLDWLNQMGKIQARIEDGKIVVQ